MVRGLALVVEEERFLHAAVVAGGGPVTVVRTHGWSVVVGQSSVNVLIMVHW